jgi:Holliday junction resolvase RusA-like endonuclease
VITVRLPIKPTGKARPRVTSHGTYMPKRYEEWRAMVRLHAHLQLPRSTAIPLACPVAFRCTFSTPSGKIRPDLDNAVGAILDAIQVPPAGGWGLIANDRQVRSITAEITTGDDCITFTIAPTT